MEIGITLDNKLIKNYEFKFNKERMTAITLILLFTATTIGVTLGGAAITTMAANAPLTITAGLGAIEEVAQVSLGSVVQQSLVADAIAKLSPYIVFITGGLSAIVTNR